MPFRSLEIVTALSPDQVLERLRKITRRSAGFWESVSSFRSKPTDPPFIGQVGPTFEIRRDIRYVNSFAPVIRGWIVPTESGETVVRIIMTIPALAGTFMAVWLFGVGGMAIVAAVKPLLVHGTAFVLGLSAMFVAGVAIMGLGFYPEARNAERIIRSALETAS